MYGNENFEAFDEKINKNKIDWSFFFHFFFRELSDLHGCIDFARAKSEALFNIYSFLNENIKSSNTKDRVKTTTTV